METRVPLLQRYTRRQVGWIIAVGSLVVPPALLTWLHSFPHYNVVFQSVDFHLLVVSAISAFAFAVAVAAAVAARRTAQGSLVVLAMGCLTVGAFMLAHGLVTPGVFGRPVNAWVGRLPVLSIVGFAACLAVAAAPQGSRPLRVVERWPRGALVVVGGGVVAAALAIILWPAAGIGAGALTNEPVVTQSLLAATGVALVGTGIVHAQRWQVNRQWISLALVVASWQTAGAVMSLAIGDIWFVAWWQYHVFLFVGFGAAAWAIALGVKGRRGVDQVLGTVFATDPLEHIEQGYSDALRVLVAAVEHRDRYTHGHSVRVAEWSVRIGQRLGLRLPQLRHLAEGAYLHDVGKIGIPDHILNKPSALDPDERAWIELHPGLGVDIAGRAPSLYGALEMIRHHHERYDGTGYPDGLAGDQIPLFARIVAVADVWDALTSERAYRAPWAPQQALAHLMAGRSTHFDPTCLDVFCAVLADEGVTADPVPGDEAVASAAASDCHHADGEHHHVHVAPAHGEG